MANSNGWGDGAANNAIGWGQGANNTIGWGSSHATSWAGATDIVGLDSSASAFISAAGITDATQISAINNLVAGMKSDGIWKKMKAIYPFVGGTASTHKYNLKDPRDLDAAFRLVFNGGWTHSSTGATPNGTNGYADTKLVPSTNGFTTANGHISFYSRNTNINGQFPVDLGVDQTGTGLNVSQKMSALDSLSFHGRAYAQLLTGVDSNNIVGLHTVTRVSTTSLKYNRNGIVIQTNSVLEAGTIPTVALFLGCTNSNGTAGLYSTRQAAFASIGDGLTDTDASNLYTRVQTYQTALSRQV
jgi:hypothetical protein